MGRNDRYGTDVSRAVIAESVLRPVPLTLSDAEVGHPIRKGAAPIPVIAWVSFKEASVELDAHAIAWTERAVRVRFQLRGDVERETWVWASAVRRREPRRG